jgi:hypothetical protein
MMKIYKETKYQQILENIHFIQILPFKVTIIIKKIICIINLMIKLIIIKALSLLIIIIILISLILYKTKSPIMNRIGNLLIILIYSKSF